MKILFATVLAGAGAAATVFATRPAPVAKVPAAPPAIVAAAPATTPAKAARRDRLDKQSRAALLTSLHKARAATPPALDREYIRAQIQELLPMIKECYEEGLGRQRDLQGKITLRFTILGHEGLGGLVSDSQVVEDGTTLADATVRECIQETIYAARFPAPADGGETIVTYPFVLLAADDDAPQHE